MPTRNEEQERKVIQLVGGMKRVALVDSHAVEAGTIKVTSVAGGMGRDTVGLGNGFVR